MLEQSRMLDDWHDFYLLIGGAAGGLIGLLFVVASLTGGPMDLETTDRGRQLYTSPVVVQLAVVLGTGALAMAPHVPLAVAAALVGAASLIGFAYMAGVAWAFARGQTPQPAHWTDIWFYGVIPAAIYAVMALAAALMGSRSGAGLAVLALSQAALLFAGVRNAWDLITYMAPRANRAKR